MLLPLQHQQSCPLLQFTLHFLSFYDAQTHGLNIWQPFWASNFLDHALKSRLWQRPSFKNAVRWLSVGLSFKRQSSCGCILERHLGVIVLWPRHKGKRQALGQFLMLLAWSTRCNVGPRLPFVTYTLNLSTILSPGNQHIARERERERQIRKKEMEGKERKSARANREIE